MIGTMIGSLLSLWTGGGLTRYAIMAAIGAGLFLGGMAVGNVRATRAFVAQIQDRDARQFAYYTNRLAQEVKAKTAELQKHLDEDAARGRSADDHATATLTAAVKTAGHDRDMALSALAKERAARPKEGIINASCPEAEPFRFGADARVLLDRAAGAGIAPAAAPARRRDSNTETAGRAP
jgi:hypothetical protein